MHMVHVVSLYIIYANGNKFIVNKYQMTNTFIFTITLKHNNKSLISEACILNNPTPPVCLSIETYKLSASLYNMFI